VKNVTHGTVLGGGVDNTAERSVDSNCSAIIFSTLCYLDEVIDPRITVKAVGRQWYWHFMSLRM